MLMIAQRKQSIFKFPNSLCGTHGKNEAWYRAVKKTMEPLIDIFDSIDHRILLQLLADSGLR